MWQKPTIPTPGRRTALVLTAALLLAACGNGDEELDLAAPEEGADPESSTVAVGTLAPGFPSIPIFHAEESGYFDEVGIDEIEWQFFPGGAAAVPALLAGEVDVIYGAYQPVNLAISEGLDDFVWLTEQNQIAPELHVLVVPEDGGITDIAELEGATVAVNALEGLAEQAVRALAAQEDIDFDTVTLTEIPFGEMGPPLERGDVDIAYVPGTLLPIVGQSLELSVLADVNEIDGMEGLPVGGLFATEEYVDANPNTIAAFLEGVERGTQDLADEPELEREYAGDLSELPPPVLEQYRLDTFLPGHRVDEVQRVADLMEEHGLVDEAPDFGAILWPHHED